MMDSLIPGLIEDERKILFNYLSAKQAAVGTILMNQGSEKRDLFFLFEGIYEVYRKIDASGEEVAVKIGSFSGPMLMGEQNLLANVKRQASILVKEDTKYFLLTYDDFCRLKEDHPGIAIKILEHAGKVTTERFIKYQDKISDTLISSAQSISVALGRMEHHIGPAVICSPELSKKLFSIE